MLMVVSMEEVEVEVGYSEPDQELKCRQVKVEQAGPVQAPCLPPSSCGKRWMPYF